MKFTLLGMTISNAEQARRILITCMLAGNDNVAQQARNLITHFEGV